MNSKPIYAIRDDSGFIDETLINISRNGLNQIVNNIIETIPCFIDEPITIHTIDAVYQCQKATTELQHITRQSTIPCVVVCLDAALTLYLRQKNIPWPPGVLFIDMEISRLFIHPDYTRPACFTARNPFSTIDTVMQTTSKAINKLLSSKNIKEINIIIVDDDSSTGTTFNFIKDSLLNLDLIEKPILNFDFFSLSNMHFNGLNIKDIIDIRDFIVLNKELTYCGMTAYAKNTILAAAGLAVLNNSNVKRFSYLHPMVDLSKRACLINQDVFKKSIINLFPK